MAGQPPQRDNIDPLSKEDTDGSVYVWFYFKSNGLPYDYLPAWEFGKCGKFAEALENAPQLGDIAWWSGLMGVYDPHISQSHSDQKDPPNLRTAFGDKTYKLLEKEHGPVRWFRHKDSFKLSSEQSEKKPSGFFKKLFSGS